VSPRRCPIESGSQAGPAPARGHERPAVERHVADRAGAGRWPGPPWWGVDWPQARRAVETVAGKWVIPVLAVLAGGPSRLGELRRRIGAGLSDKVLAETLRRMEAAGLVVRQVRSVDEPAAEYRLTETARALVPPLAALAAWQTLATDGPGPAGTRSRASNA
jgi:DNA-binding HxlR family transcriptional regulator